MAASQETKDHKIIREWAEKRGGKPARVKGSDNLLRFKFDEKTDTLEEIDWEEFFKVFNEKNLTFLYQDEDDSRFFKFTYGNQNKE